MPLGDTPPIPSDIDGVRLTDTGLAIAMGCFSGITHINKFGSSVEAAADTLEDIWDAGGLYPFPGSTADMTHVSQTADQAAARGALITVAGLDTSYMEVEQTVNLDETDSTTPVALETPIFRVNRMYVNADVTLTSTVRLHNTAETVDYADIQTDHNQTLNAIYTVPANMSAYLVGIAADHVPVTNKDPRSIHFHVMVRRNAGNEGWRVIESFGVLQDGAPYDRSFQIPIFIPGSSDVRVNCQPNGAAAHVHASFDLILVENSLLRL